MYTKYRFIFDDFKSQVGKYSGLNKKKREKLDFKSVVAAYTTEFKYTQDFYNIIYEHVWLKNGKNMIFISDEYSLRSISEAIFTIQKPDAITFPKNSFIINFPYDSNQPESDRLVSALINVMTDEEMHRDYVSPMAASVGERVPLLGNDFTKPKLFIQYCMQQNLNRISGDNPTYYCEILLEDIMPLLYSKNYGDFIEKYRANLLVNAEVLTLEECAFQFRLLRYILAFAIYAQAMPETIRPGLPGNMGALSSKDYKGTSSLIFESVNEGGEEKSMGSHYRRFHLRQLVNERFYKGEFSECPVGSRIVPVRDTYVNKDIEPETLEAD